MARLRSGRREGRASSRPPPTPLPPLPRPSSALGGARGVLSPSAAPPPGLVLSSLRLRQPDTSLRIASLTPCFGVRLFLFPFRLPAPSPSFRPHRNLTSPRQVSSSRHLPPARCQAIVRLAWCQAPPSYLRPHRNLTSPPSGVRLSPSPPCPVSGYCPSRLVSDTTLLSSSAP